MKNFLIKSFIRASIFFVEIGYRKTDNPLVIMDYRKLVRIYNETFNKNYKPKF